MVPRSTAPPLVLAAALLALGAAASPARAGLLEYGTENLLGTGPYPGDPKAGAQLQGLTAGQVTDAAGAYGHPWPFSPGPGDFPGTDQIYVGSTQTGFHDGYSGDPSRIPGPEVLTMDYGSLVPAGQTVQTLTLGLAADDFQQPFAGQPYTALVNGIVNQALTNKLNSLDETGPLTHFFTIGIDPATLALNHVLTVSIDEGGDGGDGFAVDFATVGVTTAPNGTPEPASLTLLAVGGTGVLGGGWLRRRRAARRRLTDR